MGCGIDYINKHCHVPLMRPFRLDRASNNLVVCTELHAGRSSVLASQSYLKPVSLLHMFEIALKINLMFMYRASCCISLVYLHSSEDIKRSQINYCFLQPNSIISRTAILLHKLPENLLYCAALYAFV